MQGSDIDDDDEDDEDLNEEDEDDLDDGTPADSLLHNAGRHRIVCMMHLLRGYHSPCNAPQCLDRHLDVNAA